MTHHHQPGDIVWAKVGKFPWWPAQIIPEDGMPIGKRKPIAFVRFLGDPVSWKKESLNEWDIIYARKQIQAYNSPMKEGFISKGLQNAQHGLSFKQAISIVGGYLKQKDKIQQKTEKEEVKHQDILVYENTLNTTMNKIENLIQCSNVRNNSECENNSIEAESRWKRTDSISQESDTHTTTRGDERNLDLESKSINWNNLKNRENNVEVVKKTPGRKKRGRKKMVAKMRNYRKKTVVNHSNSDGSSLPCQSRVSGKIGTFVDEMDINENSESTVTDMCSNEQNVKTNSCETPSVISTESQNSDQVNLYSSTPKHLPSAPAWDDSYLPTPDLETYEREKAQLETKTQLKKESSKSLIFDPNIDLDDCDSQLSDSDSDDDLPIGLSPLPQGHPVSEKDIVWIKWKNYPFLPALVKKIYKKRQRMSVIFVKPNRRGEVFSVSYKPQSVVPFNDPRKDEFMKVGMALKKERREEFLECVKIADDYLTKRALGTISNNVSFFLECESEEIDSDTSSFLNDGQFPGEEKVVEDEGTPVTHKRLSKRGIQRQQHLIAKNQKLVDIILSEECKVYLIGILQGTRKSSLHNIFVSGTSKERAKIKNYGFGPLDEESQMDSVLFTMLQWLGEHQKVDTNYMFDVWVPEAVVFGLKKLHHYHHQKAWEMFRKGPRRTKEELHFLHQGIINSVKNMSPTDIANYREKQKQKIAEVTDEFLPDLFSTPPKRFKSN